MYNLIQKMDVVDVSPLTDNGMRVFIRLWTFSHKIPDFQEVVNMLYKYKLR